MKPTITCLLFLFLLLNVSAQKDEDRIKTAFESYKTAIMADNGVEASKYLDSHTYQYFAQLLNHIRSSDSLTLESLSVSDKFAVLMIRHIATKKEILGFTNKGILVYALNHGMSGKNTLEGMTPGKVTIRNGVAKIALLKNRKKTDQEFHFNLENGEWKIDLTKMIAGTEKEFNQLLKETGKEENEFIFGLLDLMTDRKPTKSIWIKIK